MGGCSDGAVAGEYTHPLTSGRAIAHRNTHFAQEYAMSNSLKNRAMIGLEQLGDRLVPAFVGADPSISGGLLIETGVNDRTVVINDNGSTAAGNITVSVRRFDPLLGRNVTDSFSPGGHFHTVTHTGGSDNANVTYNLTGFLQNGSRAFDRDIESWAGGGNDTFITKVKGLEAGAGLLVQLRGEAGSDHLEVETQQGCELRPGSLLLVGLDGGTGFDQVAVDAWTNPTAIQSNPDRTNPAVLKADLSGYRYGEFVGDTNGNNVSLWYRGELDGNLQFNLMGTSYSDWVNVTMDLAPNGTGTVGDPNTWNAAVRGGDGNDSVDYMVRGAYADLDDIYHPLLDGEGGHDTVHQALGGLIIPYVDPNHEDTLVLT
jgi:hypothetical protein